MPRLIMSNTRPNSDGFRCFLCSPEPELTWLESDRFRAVLGLGPIGEGFTLIATRDHLPSMLDLSNAAASELVEFTAEVRDRLGRLYGPSVVAEHGRVAPCVAPALREHEPHCFHAHRLVFPGQRSLDLGTVAPRMPRADFGSYSDAHRAFRWPGQYVYAEDPDGSCEVGVVSGPLPRQFLRAVVAGAQGHPEIADWRANPGWETVAAAISALEAAA
jgi:diadenosine tetraphosphate (Ap4A) HIT family hydrolase